MNYFTYKPTVEEYNRYCPQWKKTLDLATYDAVSIGGIWGLMFLGYLFSNIL